MEVLIPTDAKGLLVMKWWAPDLNLYTTMRVSTLGPMDKLGRSSVAAISANNTSRGTTVWRFGLFASFKLYSFPARGLRNPTGGSSWRRIEILRYYF
jgi:hypothetical protein